MTKSQGNYFCMELPYDLSPVNVHNLVLRNVDHVHMCLDCHHEKCTLGKGTYHPGECISIVIILLQRLSRKTQDTTKGTPQHTKYREGGRKRYHKGCLTRHHYI